MRAKGVIFLVTESKKKTASVFVRLFFRFDFEPVAMADMHMRLHVMACFVLCSPNCRKTMQMLFVFVARLTHTCKFSQAEVVRG